MERLSLYVPYVLFAIGLLFLLAAFIPIDKRKKALRDSYEYDYNRDKVENYVIVALFCLVTTFLCFIAREIIYL